MSRDSFERALNEICASLTEIARNTGFASAKEFENQVRAHATYRFPGERIEASPANQVFPDISIGKYGIEVKFCLQDSWRSVANSVLESNRDPKVTSIYIVFAKMGGVPEVRWGRYEESVMHVRTSHVPRFEVEIGTRSPLFETLGIKYDDFRTKSMHEKMDYIRKYARSRLRPGERLWWLEDSDQDEPHSLPIQARLYTKLARDEKIRLRAEAVLLSPRIVSSGRSRDKYDDVVLYLLTYHGVLCHQARDLFSAGSVANPNNDDEGGLYIERALKLIEQELLAASCRMDGALFEEYWGYDVAPPERIIEWLRLADNCASTWKPSESLFTGVFSDRVKSRARTF